MLVTETPIKGLENYKQYPVTPSTIDFIYAETVRGYKRRGPTLTGPSIETWEGPDGPEKLMSTSQISGKWTGSVEACLAELDYMSHKIPGFNVVLIQESAHPGPRGFHCTVNSGQKTMAHHKEGTLALAILKCAIELALHHGLK